MTPLYTPTVLSEFIQSFSSFHVYGQNDMHAYFICTVCSVHKRDQTFNEMDHEYTPMYKL